MAKSENPPTHRHHHHHHHHGPLLAGSLVPAPEAAGSWKEWGTALKAAAGGSPQGAAKPGAAAVRAALRGSLLQLEEALLSQSVGGLAADGEPSVSEEAGSEGVGERREGGERGGSPATRSREQVGAWAGARAAAAGSPVPGAAVDGICGSLMHRFTARGPAGTRQAMTLLCLALPCNSQALSAPRAPRSCAHSGFFFYLFNVIKK